MGGEAPDQLQQVLLEQIIGSFKKKSDAVERISELLHLGKDAVYRRLRGETLLTPKEIQLLATAFGISLDSLVFQNTNSLIFSMNALSGKIHTFRDFFEGLSANIQELGAVKDSFIYYPTNEIPLFYFFFFPELLEFKLYVWGKHIWDFDYLNTTPFGKNFIPADLQIKSQQLLQRWLKIDSAEMWSANLFDNTLSQIEFHAATGGFEEYGDAFRLCDALSKLSEHLCNMAAAGKKFKPGNHPSSGAIFELYHNEMVSAYNTIYITSPTVRMVYVTFGTPNFIKSTDPRICDFTENWTKTILQKSIPISNRAEGERKRFFQMVNRRIDQTRKRLAAYAHDL